MSQNNRYEISIPSESKMSIISDVTDFTGASKIDINARKMSTAASITSPQPPPRQKSDQPIDRSDHPIDRSDDPIDRMIATTSDRGKAHVISGGSDEMMSTKPTHYDIITTVCRGRNLVAKDKSLLTGRATTSDPYVKIYYMSSLYGKTATIQKTLNPIWSETFEFTIESDQLESNKNIEFKIFDYDYLSKDDPMGIVYVHIPIDNMNNKIVSWYPVVAGYGSKQCKNATGELLIELEVRPH